MEVIVTHSFSIQRRKYWGKQQPNFGDAIKLFRRDIAHSLRYLNRPYCKIKCNLSGRTCRVLAIYRHEYMILIPLFITDKNDKQWGENMIRSSDIIKKIELLQEQTDHDLSLGLYEKR